MLDKLYLIAAVLLWAAANTDLSAHRDELGARRFRELYPVIVASELDQSRNRRWHRLGFIQRLLGVAALAVLVWFVAEDWRQGLAALLVGGCWTAAQFDVDFNVRIGNPFFYLGSSSLVDNLLGKFGARHRFAAGAGIFAIKALGVVLGVIYWAFYL